MEELRALGHTLRDPGEIGSVQAIAIDRANGGLQYGAADRRRTGGVVALP